jgi:hypothetical protein
VLAHKNSGGKFSTSEVEFAGRTIIGSSSATVVAATAMGSRQGEEEILGALARKRCLKLSQRLFLGGSESNEAVIGEAHRHLAGSGGEETVRQACHHDEEGVAGWVAELVPLDFLDDEGVFAYG